MLRQYPRKPHPNLPDRSMIWLAPGLGGRRIRMLPSPAVKPEAIIDQHPGQWCLFNLRFLDHPNQIVARLITSGETTKEHGYMYHGNHVLGIGWLCCVLSFIWFIIAVVCISWSAITAFWANIVSILKISDSWMTWMPQ